MFLNAYFSILICNVFVQRRAAPVPEERPVPTTPGASRTRRSSRRIEVPIEETKPVETADLEADNNADRDSNGSNDNEAVSYPSDPHFSLAIIYCIICIFLQLFWFLFL